MNRELIYLIKKIEKVIRDNIEVDNLTIDLSTSFKEDLDLDSFEMAQLICSLEDELKVSIEDTDIVKINTVADLLRYIEKN